MIVLGARDTIIFSLSSLWNRLRNQNQLPDGVDRCVCMLQPARTTVDGVSYMASCRTVMSRGQRRVPEWQARQIEQDDRFVSGVLTAQSC